MTSIFLFYVLYKKSAALLFEWVFRPPAPGEEIPLGYRIVASEVDWQAGGWSVVNEGTDIHLRDNSKKH